MIRSDPKAGPSPENPNTGVPFPTFESPRNSPFKFLTLSMWAWNQSARAREHFILYQRLERYGA